MKNQFKILVIAAATLSLLNTSVHAQEVRNGGGEDGVFKSIRNEIKVWMDKNLREQELGEKLGVNNPSLVHQKMVLAIESVADKVVFTKDLIEIGGSVRICKNEPTISTITCNVDAWNNSRGDTRYMIVLHEYLGIAGIETNLDEFSQYSISTRILAFVYEKQAFELGMEKNEVRGISTLTFLVALENNIIAGVYHDYGVNSEKLNKILKATKAKFAELSSTGEALQFKPIHELKQAKVAQVYYSELADQAFYEGIHSDYLQKTVSRAAYKTFRELNPDIE